MVIPLAVNLVRGGTFDLAPTYPAVFELMDEEVVAALDAVQTKEGRITFSQPFLLEQAGGVVAGGVMEEEAEQVLQAENALLFTEEGLILKEGELPLTEIPYTRDVRWEELDTAEAVRQEVSRQWYSANRTYLVLTYSMIFSVMLLAMNVFLVFGAAFFLYLAGRAGGMDMETYQESVNLILNGMGIPTLVAAAAGLLVPDITLIMSVATFGLIILIVAIYYKTRFSDAFLERQHLRAEDEESDERDGKQE